MRQLLKFEWLKFKRSRLMGKELLKLLLMGFMFLYFAVIVVGFGIGLLYLTQGADPDQDIEVSTLYKVGRFILYYFIIDIVLRFVLQKFPFVDLKSYLITPIKKSKISHYVLLRSVTHYFNVLAFLFVVSFALTINFTFNSVLAFKVFLFLSGLILFNNYIAFALTSRFDAQLVRVGIILSLLVLLLFLDIKGYIQISPVLTSIWSFTINSAWAYLLPIISAVGLYFMDFKYLSKNLYLESTGESSKVIGQKSAFNISWFNTYGNVGKLMDLELKLIIRNKRSRTILLLSLLMLTYPFLFINSSFSNLSMLASLIVTGIFALNYGQLMFSWNGSYFDLLLSRNVSLKDLFLAKYYLLALSCIIFLIPGIFYGFLDSNYFFHLPVMCIYNMSFSIFLYMLLGCFESKRIDVEKKATMNYEGISIGHFLIMIPIMGIPYLFILLFKIFSTETTGLIVLTIIGIVGILLHRQIINWIIPLFKSKKYSIAETFRTEKQ